MSRGTREVDLEVRVGNDNDFHRCVHVPVMMAGSCTRTHRWGVEHAGRAQEFGDHRAGSLGGIAGNALVPEDRQPDGVALFTSTGKRVLAVKDMG